MPPPFQTPGSSRRFLPRSSGTSSVQHSTPAASRSVFKSAGSSHAPEPTQGPKFRSAQHVLKDDIETSFAEASSSPPMPSRSKDKFRDADFDYIEDAGGEDLDVETTSAFQLAHSGAEGRNTLERFSSRGQRSANLDCVEDAYEDLETPLPRKRRRVSQPLDLISDAASSSSGHEDAGRPRSPLADQDQISLPDTYRQRDENGPAGDNTPPLSPLTISTASRFRGPRSGTTEPTPHPPRPAFRPIPSLRESGLGPTGASVLPETFSPSRHRGKQDYLPGGSAETVRNWVLGLAAAETQHGLQDQKTVRVRSVEIDPSGRSATVSTTEGERWILVGQHGQGFSRQGLSRLTSGSLVVFKGVDTRWTLNLPSSGPDEYLRAENEEKYNVSVLWEIVEPG